MKRKSFLYAPQLAAALCSCVHEWPQDADRLRPVEVTVRHTAEWVQYDQTVSRAAKPEHTARYHIQIFPAGGSGKQVKEVEFTRDDITRGDFSTTIPLPPGDYKMVAWSDWAHRSSQKSYFFDSSDFANIAYTEPYNGNNELRDAFNAESKELSVDYSKMTAYNSADYDAFYALKEIATVTDPVNESVTLTRPLAQVNWGTDDLANQFVTDDNAYGKDDNGKAKNLVTTVTISDVYSALDLLTGEVKGSAASVTFPALARPENEAFPPLNT